MPRIVAIGEVVWDIFPDGERLGGAPLNLAVHAARLGSEVRLVSAVGRDARGTEALERLAAEGVDVRHVGVGDRPTGTAGVDLDCAGSPAFRIMRPAAWEQPSLSPDDTTELARWPPDVIAFGTLAQHAPAVARATDQVFAAAPAARRVYDVNARPGFDDPVVVGRLVGHATVVKMSAAELDLVAEATGLPVVGLESFGRSLARRFALEAVCITDGAAGSHLLVGERWVSQPAPRIEVVDAVGAGDAFAAGLVHGLAVGWPADRIAEVATRLGSFVAAQQGAIPPSSPEDLSAPGRSRA